MEQGIQRVLEISAMVESKLIEVGEFLLVKAQQFCTMGSYPLKNYLILIVLNPLMVSFSLIKII